MGCKEEVGAKSLPASLGELRKVCRLIESMTSNGRSRMLAAQNLGSVEEGDSMGQVLVEEGSVDLPPALDHEAGEIRFSESIQQALERHMSFSCGENPNADFLFEGFDPFRRRLVADCDGGQMSMGV